MTGSGINRRDLLVLAGAGAVGASLTPIPAAGAAAVRRPNIILYVPDEMRADAALLDH